MKCERCGGSGAIEVIVERTTVGMDHSPDCDGSCRNCPIPVPELVQDVDIDICPDCHGTGTKPEPESNRKAGFVNGYIAGGTAVMDKFSKPEPEQDERIRGIFEYIENLEDMSNGPESLPAIACGEIRTRLFKIEEWINSRNAEIEALKAEIELMRCCGNCSLLNDCIETKNCNVDPADVCDNWKRRSE